MKVSFSRSENEVIDLIREGDQRIMERVYFKYRKEFISWCKHKFQISEEDALDHYQDSLTIFFEKVMNGSLTDLDSSLKTFLFGIGKNRIRQQFDESTRRERHKEGLGEHYRFLAENDQAMEAYEEGRTLALRGFERLGTMCQEILQYFYFEKKSMSEIARIMGHKNEGVSRTTKKRCLEKLRTEVVNPLTNE